MLQRSPTYVVSRPDEDVIANTLRRVLPDRVAYDVTRRKNVALQQLLYKRTRTAPAKVKATAARPGAQATRPPDYDVDTHFTPSYNPWDQRLCLVPNGDLFAAIRSGKASVVTDRIASFTEHGIELESGDAPRRRHHRHRHRAPTGDARRDGLPRRRRAGRLRFDVHLQGPRLLRRPQPGVVVRVHQRLVDACAPTSPAEYVCRLLNHMRATGTVQCTPRLRPSDRTMPQRPYIDDFSAGYLQRVLDRLPKQGDREPWIHPQNYTRDKKMLRQGPRRRRRDAVPSCSGSGRKQVAPLTSRARRLRPASVSHPNSSAQRAVRDVAH